MTTLSSGALVVGSINLDLRWSVGHLPTRGETVLSLGSRRGLGGKGANQAMAIRAMGVPTTMVGAVGDDEAGNWLIKALAEGGVDTASIRREPGDSGQAQVVVDEGTGDNLIIVSAGANQLLSPSHVERALAATSASVVVTQQEISPETVAVALRRAKASGCYTVLNAAPARSIDDAVLATVGLLVVNEVEATTMTGTQEPRTAAVELLGRGSSAVLVSLGSEGALLADDAGVVALPAPTPPKVIDTTGAGDVLVGVIAASLARGRRLREAVELGLRAASWSVQFPGVRAPTPTDL